MKTEISRKMDELGRIVLPGDMRNALGWCKDTEIKITLKENNLILQACRDSCCICGNETDLRPIRNKYICRECMKTLIK